MSDPIRILILEDSELDAELAQAELQNANLDFVSRRVENKDAYVLALREFDPQIILADNELPDFDGRRALAIARELRPDVPFIYVSGSITEDRGLIPVIVPYACPEPVSVLNQIKSK